MSTEAGPPPAEQAGAEAAPQIPRDPAGRFASPGEIPPPTPQGVDPNAAQQFFEGFARAETRDQAVARVLETYGYVPQGMGADAVRQAAQFYSEIQQSGVDPAYLLEVAREEAALANNPFGQYDQQQAMPGQQAPQFDPQRVTEYMKQTVQQEIAQAFQQYQSQQAEQAFVGALESSVSGALGAYGLPEGAADIVKNQTFALANQHVQAGGQMDPMLAARFAAQAAEQVRGLAQVATAQQVGAQQAAAPQTSMPPAGGAQAGLQPRPGLDGAGDRARALLEQNRAQGY